MRYFLYARKSTEEKERQIQSIPDQVKALTDIAQSRGCTIVDTITDERSARLPGRTGFNALMQRIENGEAEGILCWKIDRLTRNSLDSGVLQYKLQSGKIREIVTPEKTHYPDDNTLLLIIECGMATQFSRDLSKNVKRGMLSKIEKGWMPTKAPIGYINEKNGLKGQKRILPDPILFPIIQSLWRRLLTEQSSLMQLYVYMQENCPIFRNGKIIAFSSFDGIFRNKFYAGLFLWDGQWMRGSHQPMITQREFEAAQSSLDGNKSVRDRILNFPLKGLFHCGTCNAMITAERKTKLVKSLGIVKDYDFYRCAHRKGCKTCREKPLSAKAVQDHLLHEIESMSIPEEIIRFGMETLDEMEDMTEETIREGQLQQQVVDLSRRIKTIESNVAEESDSETRAIMKRKLNELNVQHKSMEEDLELARNERKTRTADIRNRLELIIHAKNALINGSPDEQRKTVNGLGSNWRITDKKLIYEPHPLAHALKATRKKHESDIQRFELTKIQSASGLVGDSKIMTSVWSG